MLDLKTLSPEGKAMLIFGYAMGYAQCSKDDGLFKEIPTLAVTREILEGAIQELQAKQ